MKTHEKYKPSGVEWLGDIPEHWEVKRVKEIGKVVLGKMLKSKKEEGYVLKPYLKSKNIKWLNLILDKVDEMYFNKNELIKYRLKKEDLILSEGGEVGKTSIWNDDFDECYIQNSVHKITIKKNANPYYYLYLSFYLGKSKYYDSIVNQVSIKHLTYEKLQNILWLFPPLTEQQQIANYLDKKTATIGTKINLLEQKKVYYKEYRKALINQAVTKGITNENLRMKNSGIEWIGEIPAHWEVKRGKDLFVENLKSKIPASKGKIIGKYKFFTSSNEQSTKFLDFFEMNSPSILFSTGGSAGVNYCEYEYSYSTDCWSIYNKNKNIVLNFYNYYFQSILNEIQQQGFKGSSLEHLQKDFIKLSDLILPPLEEQKAIADYLDTKTKTIDQIIDNIHQQIIALKELRKTLINEVVTGKVKII